VVGFGIRFLSVDFSEVCMDSKGGSRERRMRRDEEIRGRRGVKVLEIPSSRGGRYKSENAWK
jgi:hypothetical protein